ncbi:hypothetical protein BDB00DRAFT_193448 [Zychaea mexicana]|uniref:uncharacterized protein n=1 Tax=Zychaea mexicana TaxID=64656 RepID=UPI0022FF2299|nr:uncharacterized protein BDB00DRAFT_193448 [Zychaea mexicana]KAI9495796.1 hypothetical protein BDB00DRAFT_193448 [Zychaea mexicana]
MRNMLKHVSVNIVLTRLLTFIRLASIEALGQLVSAKVLNRVEYAQGRGQIRHRRKLCKDLFFIDVLLSDNTKEQVLFRSDDGTCTRELVQDTYRTARPGSIIRVDVGLPTDPGETTSYKVWQSNVPLTMIKLYNDPKTFIADPPLGSKGPKQTVVRQDGTTKQKADMFCKFWINQRECVRLPNCPYLHPSEEEYEEARKTWIEDRLAVRKITTHDPDDPHTSKKSHAMRAMVFVQWIHQTFGDILTDGVGVLDVAGGKGDVSMFLSHAFNIPSTVVEPEIRKRPNHWYVRLRRYACRIARNEDPSSNTPMDEKWPYELEPTYLGTLMDDKFLEDYPEIVANTGLLVGMHADQATEPIVDMALKLNKAFAVIPCCVFGHENRDRRLNNGGEVVTTEEFIQYLMEKDTRIQKSYLGFEGKNVVLYYWP